MVRAGRVLVHLAGLLILPAMHAGINRHDPIFDLGNIVLRKSFILTASRE